MRCSTRLASEAQSEVSKMNVYSYACHSARHLYSSIDFGVNKCSGVSMISIVVYAMRREDVGVRIKE